MFAAMNSSDTWVFIVMISAVLFSSAFRVYRDWKIFKNKYQAVVFDAEEVAVPMLHYQVPPVSWNAIKRVELDAALIVTKRIKLLLHDPKALIAKEPHWWNRWTMHHNNLIHGTPLVWNPNLLEGSAEVQFEQLKEAQEGNAGNYSLMDHLIDNK